MNEEDLYEKLTERILTKGSKFIPDLFRMVADEDEARIMLATPGTAPELAEKLGYSVEDIEEKLDFLYRKGLIFKADKPQGTLYRMGRDITQFHDATLLWDGVTQEYIDLWRRQTQEELPDYINMISMILPKPLTRVVTVDQPVEARTEYPGLRRRGADSKRRGTARGGQLHLPSGGRQVRQTAGGLPAVGQGRRLRHRPGKRPGDQRR